MASKKTASKKTARRPPVTPAAAPAAPPASTRAVSFSVIENALGARDLASEFGVSPSTIRRWAWLGRIAGSRDERGRWRFPAVAAAGEVGTPYEARPVEESAAPTLDEAARAFGLSYEELWAHIQTGSVRASMDAEGVLHVPQLGLQVRTLEGRLRRRRRRGLLAAPEPAPRKKKRAKKKAKKKRRRRSKPRAARFDEAYDSDKGPSPHYVPPPPPRPAPTRVDPMALEEARDLVGRAMRDFVMAKQKAEREATGRSFHDLKETFKSTYGERRWKEAYADIVDDWGLDDYIFDYEALRDS